MSLLKLKFLDWLKATITNQKFKKIHPSTYIAQIIAETCQEYFQSFIATEILFQHFYQILQNISSQHYNFNFLKYF